jgi:arylsulfatase A-like enzyme
MYSGRHTAPPRARLTSASTALGAFALATLVAAACGPRYIRSEPIAAALRAWPPQSISRNVVVVSVDGLRPDAIDMYRAPTLQRLMREGSFTLAARTIHPSTTLPSHTSMLTGQPPERHGVLWNNVATADADSIELPNIFSVARASGYATAAFFSKAKFQPLQLRGTLDYSQAPGGWFGRWSGDRTVADVAEYLDAARPNVLFVHLTDPDAAGHRAGWMTAAYGRAILAADASVGRLLELASETYGPGNFSMIVTADHGGHGTGHGTTDPRDVLIPWIAWGQGVKAGALDASVAVHTMDTAATVLWLLGLPQPQGWAGEAVLQAYHGQPAATEQGSPDAEFVIGR